MAVAVLSRVPETLPLPDWNSSQPGSVESLVQALVVVPEFDRLSKFCEYVPPEYEMNPMAVEASPATPTSAHTHSERFMSLSSPFRADSARSQRAADVQHCRAETRTSGRVLCQGLPVKLDVGGIRPVTAR